MPKQLKTKYRIDKKNVSVRRHHCGGNCWNYELRYRANGFNVSASGKTIEKAKARFLEKLRTMQTVDPSSTNDVPKTFHSFAMFFFETYRKEQVAPKTYYNDCNRYKKYLQPAFGETPIKRILPIDCKKILDKLEAEEKFKTHDEIYSILILIFKAAIAHDLITKNPMKTLLRIDYEQQSSTALTKSEEAELLSKMASEPLFQLAMALDLYTGLRPNEIATAVIEGDFIRAVNSKRHKKKKSSSPKVEYKRIYICDRLRSYLQPYMETGLPKLPSPQLLRRRISAVLPGHMLKDLRKTFNSRCKELGVSDPAREHFMGHVKDKLDKTYTELATEYLLSEGKKLNNW